jgi:hypothetical protein
MHVPRIEAGLVIRYNYLWHDQSMSGMENGIKARPCVALLLTDANRLVKVLPITHTPPKKGTHSVEIPATVSSRLGLDEQLSWIICSELNEFRWPGPDLDVINGTDSCLYGPLTPKLYEAVRKKVLFLARGRTLKIVKRTE